MRYLKRIYNHMLARHSWMQLVHELFVSKGFRREILAVHAGMKAHQDLEHSDSGKIYRLRRNIHRLEKGLIMSPRRDIFALDYIAETVAVFVEVAKFYDVDENELRWFSDVLQEYFSLAGSHTIINSSREVYETAKLDGQQTEQRSIPRERRKYRLSSIGYDEFYTLCCQRRSVRWYLDKMVPRDLVDKAILAAAQSPSACNRQPFEFRIFDDPQLVEQVAGIPGGTKGFTHQFPMVIVLVGKLSAYEFQRDRHVIYIDASLAAMSLMFALETLGLSSCPINWPDVERFERKMDEALGLVPHERPVMLLSVGYAKAEGKIPYSHKKNLAQLRRYN